MPSSPFDLKRAVDFNASQLDAGKLTPGHLANLVYYFQVGRRLDDDGCAGSVETIPAIDAYVRSLAGDSTPDPAHPLADFCWPLPRLVTPLKPDGVKPEISNGFGADRDVDPETGVAKRLHGGCDIMYRRAAAGAEKLPDYLTRWYCPQDPEVPIVACGPGKVVIAGQGKAKNGKEVIEIVVDHGVVESVGPLAFEALHCKRLLVSRGATVSTGQPIAIVGNTATDTTHLHFEAWNDKDDDGKPERSERINPALLLMKILRYATYTPSGSTFDPSKLVLA